MLSTMRLRLISLPCTLSFALLLVFEIAHGSFASGPDLECGNLFPNLETLPQLIETPRPLVSPDHEVKKIIIRLAKVFISNVQRVESIAKSIQPIAFLDREELDPTLFLTRIVLQMGSEDTAAIFNTFPEPIFGDKHVEERIQRWRSGRVDLPQLRNRTLVYYSRVVRSLLAKQDLKIRIKPRRDNSGILRGVTNYVTEERLDKFMADTFFSLVSEPGPLQKQIVDAYNDLSEIEQKVFYGHYVTRVAPTSLARILQLPSAGVVVDTIDRATAKLNISAQWGPNGLSDPADTKSFNVMPRSWSQDPNFQTNPPPIEFHRKTDGIRVSASDIGTALDNSNFGIGIHTLTHILHTQFYLSDNPIIDSNTMISLKDESAINATNQWAQIDEDKINQFQGIVNSINNLPPHLRIAFFLKYVAYLPTRDIQSVLGLNFQQVRMFVQQSKTLVVLASSNEVNQSVE